MSQTSETEHPSAKELHDFVNGLLASSRAEELERHINSCPSCSDFVETHFSSPGGESRIGWTDEGQLLTFRQPFPNSALQQLPLDCRNPYRFDGAGLGLEKCKSSCFGMTTPVTGESWVDDQRVGHKGSKRCCCFLADDFRPGR